MCPEFIRWRPIGKAGNVALAIGANDAAQKVTKLDILDESRRKKAVDEIAADFPGLDTDQGRAELSERLISIANEIITGPAGADAAKCDGDKDDPDALLKAMPESIRAEAEAMLSDPSLIKRAIDDVAALGVAGERELIASVYLVGVSRLLKRPLAAIVQGPSSSGKSYLVEKTAGLFPPEAVIHATQMTPQALFHMHPGSLKHRFIVAGERSRIENDDTAEATRALREMISSGRLTKLMPVKMNGGIETVRVEQEGPIAFVESTTLTKIFNEDANRCILLHTDERSEQTRRIVERLAEDYSGLRGIGNAEAIVQKHYAMQRMLQGMVVVVPFAERVAEGFTCDRVEVRRAFPQLMSMVQASALLHQRQRKIDGAGQLVASEDDYQLARHLLQRLLSFGPSEPARRFHERLQAWTQGQVFSTSEARGHERASKSSVSGWLGELHEVGMVDLVEPGRGRVPATWQLSAVSPEQTDHNRLPTLESVFPECGWTHGRKPQLVDAT